jgi:hypothetical protein
MKKQMLCIMISIMLTLFWGCDRSSIDVTTTNTTSSETLKLLTIDPGLIYHKPGGVDEIIIDGYTGTSTELVIPAMIDGLPVTEIASYAFEDSDLELISIPASVTTIGAYAFNHTPWLDQKTDEQPIFVINNRLIDARKATGDVVIPEGVTTIPMNAFYGLDINSVHLPDSLVSIGPSAFENSNLTTINIPSSVKFIFNSAFENTKLTSIHIPASVTQIDDGAFKESTLQSITFEDGSMLEYIGGSAFMGTQLTSIIIPISVQIIGHLAFYGIENMTIYAEAASQPEGWLRQWNTEDFPVVWNYQKS